MTEHAPKPSDPEAKAPERPDEMLMEHEYDGIKEYDNPLPRWWVWIFWGTFLFALAYFVHFHLLHTGNGIIASYDEDVKAAVARGGPRAPTATEASLAETMTNADAVRAGAEIFGMRCMPCHGDKAQGVVGPNLTDNSWIHGDGKLLDIYTTVSGGVLEKGMPAWSKQLSPKEVMDVVAYVGTLRGTKVPGKPPEGHEVKGY